MSIVVLKLSDVKGVAEDRPTHCPSCKGDILRRWGGSVRKIRDQRVKVAIVYRYRCCRCRHTFRHYPAGVDQAQQSQPSGIRHFPIWLAAQAAQQKTQQNRFVGFEPEPTAIGFVETRAPG